MGMARVQLDPYDLPVRRSTVIHDGFYCARDRAHYKPNMRWGYVCRQPGDTSGRESWSGVRKLGDECPFCGRAPVSVGGDHPKGKS